MSERDKILGRIREALGRSKRPASTGAVVSSEQAPGASEYAKVLPAVGEALEALIERFAKESEELRTEFRVLSGESKLEGDLTALLEREGWKRLAAHRTPLIEPVVTALGLPTVWTDAMSAAGELEACDVGISECDCLVAQTGSVVVTSRSAGGRSLSVLPPHHLVLAKRDQLVPGLPDAFARLEQRYGTDYPSMMSFITGPSRTGDIERILVLGAHGPKKLTVVLV